MDRRDSQLRQPLSTQIGRRRRPTNFFRRIFVTRPSRSFSVLLVLTAHFITYRSGHSISHPVLHTAPRCPRAGLPTTLSPRKPAESPLCPTLRRTANTVSLQTALTTVLSIDRLGLSPLAPHLVVARNLSPHVRCTCFFRLALWPCRTRANTHEHQLPVSIRQLAVTSGVCHQPSRGRHTFFF